MISVVTFDIDMFDYLNNQPIDEMEFHFENIFQILEKYPSIKTTWFIRIDSYVEKWFGRRDYILNQHKDKLDFLASKGHDIQWHYHPIIDKMRNFDIDDFDICAKTAINNGMVISRVGWGFMSNELLDLLVKKGFKADSSAIPRPIYPWIKMPTNWSRTKNQLYYPDSLDFSVAGSRNIQNIVEIPVSTVKLPMQTDTIQGVKRYINPAYNSYDFSRCIDEMVKSDYLITITHPYECCPNKTKSELLSFDLGELDRNFCLLVEKSSNFMSVSEIYKYHKNNRGV